MHVTGEHAAPPASFRPASRLERRLLAVLVLAAAVHAASTVLRTPGQEVLWADVLYALAYIGAGTLCVLRARRQRGQRWAWAALATGLFANCAGDIYYSLFFLNEATPAYPSPANWLWLAFYPATYLALVLFLRGTVKRFVVTMWLDALISALAVAAVAYAVAFEHLLDVSGGSIAVVLTNMAYPVGDLLLLVLVAVAAIFGGLVDRLWALLGLGFLSFAVADTWFAVQASTGRFLTGTPTESLWTLTAVLIAIAAVARPQEPTPPEARPWWHVMILPVVFASGSLALLVYGQDGAVPRVSVVLALASLVVGVVRANVNYWEATRLLETRQQALTDDLTGLRNRRGFILGLDSILREPGEDRPVAVLLIDLDRFKEINDALGHSVGDQLLTLVGPRMHACLREEDLLARLGGDEFAIALSSDADAKSAPAVAERIARALTTPFELDDITLHIGASIGIALCPDHGTDGPTLLQRADVAMYDAKGSGGGYRLYDPKRDSHSRDRLQTIEQLRAAITREELVVHYQPKVDLLSGQVPGVEALVRWRHPQRGLLLPEEFLPLAEQSGLMRPLTDHVLDTALAQLRTWRAHGWDLGVAVNVSASNLLDVALPLQVAAKLSEYGVPADRLSLEITETTIMADPVRARQVVKNLHDHGVLVSVDDFGTGYSSLAYLRHLAVRELKLDRDFVKDVCLDTRSSAIVRSTVDLAHSLGLHMVAEGVEDAESARKLTEYGCDIAQGHHYSRPVSAADLTEWLLDRHDDQPLPAAG
ncbi:MAG TPA: EAL domain-containing protein [Nocardioidaceae bacterium]|nr:EAL domain-containing protein [Nocardioidaceae bacterium]